MRSFLFIILLCVSIPLFSQNPTSFDELTIESDSTPNPYKPTGKNYAFIKAKRGSDGVAKTSRADSILSLSLPITDIVLVFSELSPSSINNRLENNQERWENMLKTYSSLFQFNTNLKEICQCKIGGDTGVYRKGNGFYVYFAGKEPKVQEKKVEEKKVEEKPVVTKTEKTKQKEEKKEEKVATKTEKTSEKKEDKSTSKTKETPVVKEKEKEKPKQKEKEEEKEEETSTAVEGPEQTVAVEIVPKKKGYTKPRRSKDIKACRPPCYLGGDEDLNTFFKENIVLNKKQKRAVKSSVSIVKLQLNFDGSVKKALVNGTNTQLNELVTVAIKNMDLWNPAVKGGVTVKSEVKLTLKYDKSTKAIKVFETMITPRPNPKCTECKSDSEIFGSD